MATSSNKDVPNSFQRRAMWTAITTLSVATVAALIVGFIWLVTRLLAFLQPILIPFAVAGVLAYLLDPVVDWLKKRGLSRAKAVWTVFIASTLLIVGILLVIVPAFVHQGAELAGKLPGYTATAKKNVTELAQKWNEYLKPYGVDLLQWDSSAAPNGSKEGAAPGQAQPPQADPNTVEGPPAPSEAPAPAATNPPAKEPKPAAKNGDGESPSYTLQDLVSGSWLASSLPDVGRRLWEFIRSSVGGFLGVFGFILSMIIVPLYLYYFLMEGPKIANSWSNYVPLRASEFKDDVVGTLTEINRYLISFFRGQLVVSLINGVATGLGLVIVGVKFGWLIGLVLCLLGIIPYLGIILCWIPAVIIASVQGGSYLVPADSPWWVFPLVVTAIFVVVQQIDGLFITPKIVGESVGLHPMTVIVSVFVWSLVLGGLLGAILAVPMTAALKVLFQRYIWQRGVQRRFGNAGGRSATT